MHMYQDMLIYSKRAFSNVIYKNTLKNIANCNATNGFKMVDK